MSICILPLPLPLPLFFLFFMILHRPLLLCLRQSTVFQRWSLLPELCDFARSVHSRYVCLPALCGRARSVYSVLIRTSSSFCFKRVTEPLGHPKGVKELIGHPKGIEEPIGHPEGVNEPLVHSEGEYSWRYEHRHGLCRFRTCSALDSQTSWFAHQRSSGSP